MGTEPYLPILRREKEIPVKSIKIGKSSGIDNIPAELIQSGDDKMIDVLTTICKSVWKTGKWPKALTQSLVITLPRKGSLQLYQNNQTISLISHPSNVMLKVILNRLKPQADTIIAEDHAGFRAGRSTSEHIFNLRVLCQNYASPTIHIPCLHRFQEDIDRLCHAAPWASMKKDNISHNLVCSNASIYSNTTSDVFYNGSIGEWVETSVGVR